MTEPPSDSSPDASLPPDVVETLRKVRENERALEDLRKRIAIWAADIDLEINPPSASPSRRSIENTLSASTRRKSGIADDRGLRASAVG